jgi:hypothetical protein
VHERGQTLDVGGLDELAVRVGEREETVGPRAEELARLVLRAGHQERGPAVGSRVRLQDAARRIEHPRALVREGIEYHDHQMERRQPLGERSGLPAQWSQREVGGRVRRHGRRR